MEFFSEIFLSAAFWPCVSAFDRNENQEYFLGVKAASA
jgi:hypothetical protein